MNGFIVFIIFYFGLSNWIQLRFLLGNIFKSKAKLVKTNGKGLIKTLNKKTGLDLKILLIDEKEKAIGFMVSSPPFKPVMIFSDRLYKLLNKKEFEWVALHESGHYLMWHNLKMAVTEILVGLIGAVFLFSFSLGVVMQIFLAILLAIIYIQLAKIFEYQADYFAITNMEDPRAVISGNLKMKKVNLTLDGNKLFQWIWVIQVPYEKRIEMAKKELLRRKLSPSVC